MTKKPTTNERLVGFVHRYEDGTYSLWGVDLAPEDEEAINEILLKYQNEGVSVRGDADSISLDEAL